MYNLMSSDFASLWKMSHLGFSFGYSAPLTANPVLPVYTVDVVSRFSQDWGLANIVAVLILQGLSALASVCDVHKGLY